MKKGNRTHLSLRQRKKRRLDFICYILLTVPLFAISTPLLACLASSLKDGKLIFIDKGLIPQHPTLENYKYVLFNSDFLNYFRNSMILSSFSTVCCVLIGCLTGYAISRFRGKGFNLFKLMTYVLQMIQIGLVFLPMYIVINKLGLYNTYGSVILLYIGQIP